MKRILLTGGPTNEPIDEVMKITNMSTGKLTLQLAQGALSKGDSVCLIVNESVTRSDLFERYGFSHEENLTVIPVDTTLEMYRALETQAATAKDENRPYDVVIHASAVGDYKPEFSFRMEDMATELASTLKKAVAKENNPANFLNSNALEPLLLQVLTNPLCKVNDNTKISSYEPHLTVKLTLTEKLISHLRDWYPEATLIGFKLLENVTTEHLIEVARALCMKNKMDYILANDLALLRLGDSTRYLVNEKRDNGLSLNAKNGPSLVDYATENWF